MSKEAVWPHGSYCRELDCEGEETVFDQSQCLCEYTNHGAHSSIEKVVLDECAWRHPSGDKANQQDRPENYCRRDWSDWPEAPEGCSEFTVDLIRRAKIKNWDEEKGIFCSKEPFEDFPNLWPLGTVCWYSCLPGFRHEESGMSHNSGVAGECHLATYNNIWRNIWRGEQKKRSSLPPEMHPYWNLNFANQSN